MKTTLTLYSLSGVVIALPDGGQLGPIAWDVSTNLRAAVSCADPAHWDALMDFLTGLLPPTSGEVIERESLIVQTDRNLLEQMKLNRPISDFLRSPDLPPTLWLDHRVRSSGVLLEWLELTPKRIRRDLKLETDLVREKYLAFRFMLSQADLLMGEEVYRIGDPPVQNCLRLWWDGFQGALICRDDGQGLPGPVNTRVRIDREGGVTITPVQSAQ